MANYFLPFNFQNYSLPGFHFAKLLVMLKSKPGALSFQRRDFGEGFSTFSVQYKKIKPGFPFWRKETPLLVPTKCPTFAMQN